MEREERPISYNVWYAVDDLRDRLTGSLAYLAKDLQDLIDYSAELTAQIEALRDDLEALNRFHPDNRDDRH